MKREMKTTAESVEQLANVTRDGLVTVEEAAKFLGLSRAFIYVLMERGELRSCRIGRTRRIPRASLVALAEKSLVSA
jgi:excisionase family DNA binding protein